jgi:DNA-binding response OmpR family regulator
MLGRARGAWVPREALASAAGVRLTGRALDMLVSRLRRKIRSITEEWDEPPQLITQRGFGYSLRL